MNNIAVLLFTVLIVMLALNATYGKKPGYVILADIIRGLNS